MKPHSNKPVIFKQPEISPRELWQMPADEFNKWRIENDFPRILDFMKQRFARFSEWQKEFSVLDNDLITSGISPFLRNGPRSQAFCVEERGEASWWFREKHKTNRMATNKIVKSIREVDFIPYQLWAQRKRIRVHPKAWRTRINSASHGGGGSIFLLNELELLKIGDLTVRYGNRLGEQFFQFTNASNLRIANDVIFNGRAFFHFCYASGLLISGDRAFFEFYECNFGSGHPAAINGLQLVNGRFQDFHFDTCGYTNLFMKGSLLYQSSFRNCGIDPMIEDSRFEGVEFQYDINANTDRSSARKLYGFARKQYAKELMWEEASRYALREKWQDALEEWSPTLRRRKWFGNNSGGMSIGNIIERWRYGEGNLRSCLKFFWKRVLYALKVSLFPHYLAIYLFFKIRAVVKILNLWIWGAGERPFRVLPSSAIVILIYSAIYYFSRISVSRGSIADSLQLSLASFATMTVSDFSEANVWLGLLVSSEALFGILFLGLFIAGFASKAKTH